MQLIISFPLQVDWTLNIGEQALDICIVSFIQFPKGNAKECSDCLKIALISYANKVILKILQARLQLYLNQQLPDVQAGFRKGRGTRDQIANIHLKKQTDSRNTSISAH